VRRILAPNSHDKSAVGKAQIMTHRSKRVDRLLPYKTAAFSIPKEDYRRLTVRARMLALTPYRAFGRANIHPALHHRAIAAEGEHAARPDLWAAPVVTGRNGNKPLATNSPKSPWI